MGKSTLLLMISICVQTNNYSNIIWEIMNEPGERSVDWVEGMTRNGRVTTETMNGYLSAYLQAAKMHLDERGAPIVEWLSSRIDFGNGGGK